MFKKIAIIGLILKSLVLTTLLIASEDQEKQYKAAGGLSAASAVYAGGQAVANAAAQNWGMAGLYAAQTGLSTYSAAYNFKGAKEFKSPDGFSYNGGIFDERMDNFNNNQNQLNTALENAKGVLTQIRKEGYDVEDMLNNPDKYLSPEEAKEVGSLSANPESKDMLKKMGLDVEKLTIFNSSREIASESGQDNDSQGKAKFDYNDFLANLLKERSPTGYYGNVLLKSLAPDSKKSLFERVSTRIKEKIL